MIDVDEFKSHNDHFGPRQGISACNGLRPCCRRRSGGAPTWWPAMAGEEFVILLCAPQPGRRSGWRSRSTRGWKRCRSPSGLPGGTAAHGQHRLQLPRPFGGQGVANPDRAGGSGALSRQVPGRPAPGLSLTSAWSCPLGIRPTPPCINEVASVSRHLAHGDAPALWLEWGPFSTDRSCTMTLSGFQGLVFDLDGTLVDSMPLHLAAWEHTPPASLVFGSMPTGSMNWGHAQPQDSSLLVAEVQQIALDPGGDPLQDGALRRQPAQGGPFPAMLDLVERYHGLIPMGIGTGSPRVNAEAVLRNTGLDRYFPVVVTADDVELHKPHPDTFLLVAHRLGWSPRGQCLVFEDTGMGAQAGEAAGMQGLHGQEGNRSG